MLFHIFSILSLTYVHCIYMYIHAYICIYTYMCIYEVDFELYFIFSMTFFSYGAKAILPQISVEH